MNDAILDGYGLSFPEDRQEAHREAIRKSLKEYEDSLSTEKIEHVEPEWKDKPAGWQSEKGSGV